MCANKLDESNQIDKLYERYKWPAQPRRNI